MTSITEKKLLKLGEDFKKLLEENQNLKEEYEEMYEARCDAEEQYRELEEKYGFQEEIIIALQKQADDEHIRFLDEQVKAYDYKEQNKKLRNHVSTLKYEKKKLKQDINFEKELVSLHETADRLYEPKMIDFYKLR